MTERLLVLVLLLILVVTLTRGVKPARLPAVLVGLGLVLTAIAKILGVFPS